MDSDRTCSKSKCKKKLPSWSEYQYATCERCREQGARSAQRRRQQKCQQDENTAPLEQHSPAAHENPPPPSCTDNPAKPSPRPCRDESTVWSSFDSDSESDESLDSKTPTTYPDAQAMFESLRHAAKAERIEFRGTCRVPHDPFTSCKERVQMTIREVWNTTGFRFTVHDNRCMARGHQTRLWCCQDEDRKKKARPVEGENVVHRDYVGMRRYPCESHLRVTCLAIPKSPTELQVSIHLIHNKKHLPYEDVEMPMGAIKLIQENLEIAPSLLVGLIQKEYKSVTSAQIHRSWATLTEELWRRDKDQLKSTQILLREYKEDVDVFDVEVEPGVEQLCWGMKKINTALKGKVVEIALDATYNVDSRNLELYSIMSEHDNAGFPLSYCFLSTAQSLEQGKRILALERWAVKLRDQYGVNPQWVLTDKDMAEISMSERVWNLAKHQLCWWHQKRAVKERLAKTKLSTTPYKPALANKEFPFIRVDFTPHGRADPKEYEGGAAAPAPTAADHHNHELAPLLRGPNSITLHVPALSQIAHTRSPLTMQDVNEDIKPPLPIPAEPLLTLRIPRTQGGHIVLDESDSDDNDETLTKHTFCPENSRTRVLKMMEAHYNAHPLIPGYSAPTREGIRWWAVEQMYKYCESEGLPNLWAYLWENWYRPSRWKLWARSMAEGIPRLRTTMILESHWRRLKKDFLHHFHKPRLDLLTWILVTKLAPTYYRKLDILLKPSSRYRELSSWRKAFKRDWLKALKTEITLPLNAKYKPDPHRWVCTCPHFANSRFLLCKHLVQAVHTVPAEFFLEVNRHRTAPIWRHPGLVPLEMPPSDAGSPSLSEVSYSDTYPESCFGDSEQPDEGDSDQECVEVVFGGSGYSHSTFRERLHTFLRVAREFCNGVEYQEQFLDHRFLNTLEKDCAGFLRLANNCLELERQYNSTRGSNPNTWDTRRSNAMFYRTRPPARDRES